MLQKIELMKVKGTSPMKNKEMPNNIWNDRDIALYPEDDIDV